MERQVLLERDNTTRPGGDCLEQCDDVGPPGFHNGRIRQVAAAVLLALRCAVAGLIPDATTVSSTQTLRRCHLPIRDRASGRDDFSADPRITIRAVLRRWDGQADGLDSVGDRLLPITDAMPLCEVIVAVWSVEMQVGDGLAALNKARGSDRARLTWLRHVVSAALGIAFVLAVEGVTLLERDLRAVQQRDVVAWPSWAIAGLFLLLGVVMLVFVLMSPRMPWLPTAAAVLLLYGMLAVLPSSLVDALSLRGPRVSSVYWGQSIIPMVAGVMTATAAWSWWRSRRQAVGS